MQLLNQSVVSSWVKLTECRYFLDTGTNRVSLVSVSRCWHLEGNDKILLVVSYQFDPVSPPTAKRHKIDSKVCDGFVVVTPLKIKQACKDDTPMKIKGTTLWSTNVWDQWLNGTIVNH